jgi:hypothetical protein
MRLFYIGDGNIAIVTDGKETVSMDESKYEFSCSCYNPAARMT